MSGACRFALMLSTIFVGVVASVFVTAGSAALAATPSPVPQVAAVQPAAGAVVGVAAPVVVTFTAPVVDRFAAQRSIRVLAAGRPDGRFTWLDNTTVQWKPDRFWPAHSPVTILTNGGPTVFGTGAAVLGVASISAHTFTVSIDGKVAREMPASMGKPSRPTPIGSFSVLEQQRSVVMDSRTIGIPLSSPEGYRLTAQYAERLTWGGVYVHSAPWSVGSQGNQNVSHGCINLSPENAEWYYDTVSVGDPVIVRA